MTKSERPDPIWLKWQCDMGSQWTTVKNSPSGDESQNGNQCLFSGCFDGNHNAHIVGETSCRMEAHKWFMRANLDSVLKNQLEHYLKKNYYPEDKYNLIFDPDVERIKADQSSASWGGSGIIASAMVWSLKLSPAAEGYFPTIIWSFERV